MDYKLFDDRTKEFLGWLRNQGFPAVGGSPSPTPPRVWWLAAG